MATHSHEYNHMIIGITGTNGAGKGTVVAYLQTKGFVHFSARALLTETLDARGLIATRENLILISNELRNTYGPDYVAKTLFERAKHEPLAIIESIRTVSEIQTLASKGDFILLAIDASRSIRYARIQSRKSSTDTVSYEQFSKLEDLEMQNNDPAKHNLFACQKLADERLENNGDILALYAQIDAILKKYAVMALSRKS